jgi:cobalt-zinc-cadmium efflux system protein
MSPHTHNHTHEHLPDATGRRLLFTLALNLLIPSIQVVGGLMANSMALLSDAAHNFSDSISLFIAYVANRMSKKEATLTHTFGYQRVEILAAVANVGLLVGAAGFIVYEAGKRLLAPEPVAGMLVILIAGVGILGNGFSVWLLYRDSKHSLNVRGAFLHLLGDLLTSVVVAANGLLLLFWPAYWLDPLLSIGIALFILKNCWGIVREAVHILMNATPAHLDLKSIKMAIEELPEIANVHYLHVWHISSRETALSCHVVVAEDKLVSQTEIITNRIRSLLASSFSIHHPVIQFETAACGEGDLLCRLPQCGRS